MARLAAAVLACGLLFAAAVRKDVAGLQKEDSDVSKELLIRELHGRTSALEGHKLALCCLIPDGGFCMMSPYSAGCSGVKVLVDYKFCFFEKARYCDD
eukprot:CAMPEP_0181486828 /NCGR_PEP_ID=MMETSP1110-20121109/47443_1 /TAXON_ID=174948 /ORGANISM="Symbiodinium sp., Strain CCMP421" /LENGTH=97 /DNA_ID=CAMNT_0023613193 /DNA_START=48 /DNA_END=344 /DNA_ORIENTATION=-